MKLGGLIISKTKLLCFVSQFLHSCICDRSWEYINRSQKHKCKNWERGRAVSFLGIHKSNFWDIATGLKASICWSHLPTFSNFSVIRLPSLQHFLTDPIVLDNMNNLGVWNTHGVLWTRGFCLSVDLRKIMRYFETRPRGTSGVFWFSGCCARNHLELLILL